MRMELEVQPQCMILLILSFDLLKEIKLENDTSDELQALQSEIASNAASHPNLLMRSFIETESFY